tara:strand:- start:2481 stop:3614 length:1134 start_codon:yes stop_codon:yes gene_type:complete
MSGGNNNNNIEIISNEDNFNSPQIKNESPKLSVSTPAGIEFLTKGSTNSNPNSNENTPEPKKTSEFSFFKPSTDEKTEPTNSVEMDDMLINKTKDETADEMKPIHRLSPQDIKNEKIDLLYKFKKLESQGIRTTMNYNMNSHLEDMRNEYIKLKKQREIDNSIKFQRKMLMACVTGLEFLNNRFDPFNVKLDGWGESVNENLNDYDEIFEELNEKYGGTGDMAPELRLLFTLAGSAFMFHLSNTMFKSSIPGMDDILQQNPELMKQFAEAAVGSINKGGSTGQSMPPPMNPISMMMGMGGMGGMGAPNNSPPPQQQGRPRATSPARSDMSAPDGIDDLINKMNLQPDKIPDLDSISLMSGDTDRKSSGTDRGITLNL